MINLDPLLKSMRSEALSSTSSVSCSIFTPMISLALLFIFSFVGATPVNSYEGLALKTIQGLEPLTSEVGEYKNHYYRHRTGQKKALILVSGVAEPIIKYWPLVIQFKDSHDIYLWDHIGQGHSPKLMPGLDRRKTHIDDFKSYQTTFHGFLKPLKSQYEEVHVISHSMGSHIMVDQLLQYPDSLDKLVLVAPMINIRRFSLPTSWAIAILKLFYQPTDWAPFQSDKNPDYRFFTNSQKNFSDYQNLLRSHFPEQKSTGVTAGWLVQAFKSIERVKALDPSKVSTPVLLMTAGKDVIVQNSAAEDLCQSLKNCQHKLYKQGKHQLLLETKNIQSDLYERIKKFFK